MSRIDGLHPKVKELASSLILKAGEAGHHIVITQGLRTNEEQAALYAQGRIAPGKIVTNAKPGQSFHNFGVAFDIALVKADKGISWDTKMDVDDNHVPDFTDVGLIGESLGLEWGGRFNSIVDLPHFQFTGGLTLKDFQEGKKLV